MATTQVDVFSDLLQPAPVNGGFRMEDYWVWGGSCIRGEDGRYHLFASRWPKYFVFMQGYIFYSEIVHAVSDNPEGPYEFKQVALPPRGSNYWDGRMTHNPTITRHGDTYYLFYIGSTYEGPNPTYEELRALKRVFESDAYTNIRIGVASSKTLDGPWERLDHPILAPQPDGFDRVVVTNPAPCVQNDGSVYLVYRTFIRGEGRRLGLAHASNPLGPYKRVIQQPIANGDVEDPFLWQSGDRFFIIAKDMTGEITGEVGAGVFLSTRDLTDWHPEPNPKAYSRTILWDDGTTTVQGSFERPQLLIDEGIPTHLFAATADGPGGFYAAENTWTMVIPLKN